MAQTLKGWNVPAPYVALRNTASGRKGATRWSIYKGQESDDTYVGDIVSFLPEQVWSSQPSGYDQEMTEHETAEAAFKALVRATCGNPAEYIVMFDTDHEDDEAATRVCRAHMPDSVDVHWKAQWTPSTPRPGSQRTLGKIIVSRINLSAGFFCEKDVI